MQEIIDLVSKNPILSLIWVALALSVIFTIFKEKTAKYKVIDPAKLTQLINHEEAKVIDVRSQDEFRLGHITGSVQVSEGDIIKNNLGNVTKDKSVPIVVVSKTGAESIKNANELIKHEFANVYVLKDGLISWAEAKMPLVRGKK